MEVFIVTHMGMDSPWPSVVFISLTPEGARHYVDEAVKGDSQSNAYRAQIGIMPYEYKCESIDDAAYSMDYHYFPYQESKLLYKAYNQHNEGYAILAVKVKQ